MAQTSVYLPEAFLTLTQEIMPDHLSMDDFIAACQRPLRKSLRVNTLKISIDAFLILAKKRDWQLTAVPWCPEGFWIEHDEAQRLGNTPEHLSGLFYIQEASSMMPVTALFDGLFNVTDQDAVDATLDSNIMILDMAAAPGSKTTQIAANLANNGAVVANEFSASRVKVLHSNVTRCGISNTALTHFDGRVFGAATPEAFDAILLDAPCSGEGVLRKDADAMHNWSPESVTSIADTQKALIDSAFHALKPGGVMVYSTCTLNAQENQQVISWLCDTYGDAVSIEPLNTLFHSAELAATQEGFLHVFPQIYDCEGFFVARLRKHHSVPKLDKLSYKLGKFPFAPLPRKESETLFAAANKVGIKIADNHCAWQRDKEIWLFPTKLESILKTIRFSRIGLKLAEQFPKGFRWQHEAVIALGDATADNAFALDNEQLETWFQGKDIYPEQTPDAAELLLTYQGAPVGIAKKIGSRIKNNLPRELVKDGKLEF